MTYPRRALRGFVRSCLLGLLAIGVAVGASGCSLRRSRQAAQSNSRASVKPPSRSRPSKTRVQRRQRQPRRSRARPSARQHGTGPNIAVATTGGVRQVPLERYVAGVVHSEMPGGWPLEALKAQAVAVRTYALWQRQRRAGQRYHVRSDVLDQVYRGRVDADAPATKAAMATRGQVLAWNGELAHTYFHAACGDHTASGQEVWGQEQPYLRGVRCGFCRDAGKQFRWSVHVDYSELNRSLKQTGVGQVKGLRMGSRLPSGRLRTVRIMCRGSQDIPATKLRALVGYNRLPSTWISRIQPTSRGVTFTGQGHGHGVGMCQWGARGMARQGATAEQILARYYPGTRLTNYEL
ncbi:MAG: SpoIID/LytB domain-containing protein [Myxococcota bacterium]